MHDTDFLYQAMWRNPVTEKQIRVLTDDWGVKEEATYSAGETRSIIGWFKVITVSLAALYQIPKCYRS